MPPGRRSGATRRRTFAQVEQHDDRRPAEVARAHAALDRIDESDERRAKFRVPFGEPGDVRQRPEEPGVEDGDLAPPAEPFGLAVPVDLFGEEASLQPFERGRALERERGARPQAIVGLREEDSI